jgi:putative oxidoreductase
MIANLDARLNPRAPAVLSLFRVVFGLLLLCHATQKLIGWPVGSQVATGTWPLWYAGVVELVCGVLITLGLFTRIAAFVASGEMAFAFFTQHFPKGFWPIENGGELAVMNCFAFLLLVFTGGGLYALDSRMGRYRTARTTATPRRRWRR